MLPGKVQREYRNRGHTEGREATTFCEPHPAACSALPPAAPPCPASVPFPAGAFSAAAAVPAVPCSPPSESESESEPDP